MLRTILMTSIAASLSGAVFADPIDGKISLAYTSTETQNEIAVFTDFTWDLSFSGVGLSVGSYGMWTQDAHPHETYASIFVDIQEGRLSAGVPRPAYDLYATSIADDTFPLIGMATLSSTRSYATAVAADGAGVPLGALYSIGDEHAGLSISAHNIDRVDTSIISFAGTTTVKDIGIGGGLEVIDADGDTRINAKIKATLEAKDITFTAGYFATDYDDAPNLAEVGVKIQPSPRLTASAFIIAASGGSFDALLGTSVAYSLTDHIGLDAGVAIENDGDTALSASVGWQF